MTIDHHPTSWIVGSGIFDRDRIPSGGQSTRSEFNANNLAFWHSGRHEAGIGSAVQRDLKRNPILLPVISGPVSALFSDF